MIDILLRMLIDLFGYAETNDETRLILNHVKRYYAKVKSQLKSEYARHKIEATALSIETQLKYLCNYYFKDVTTLGFLGNSIVELVNNGLESGGVDVSTNMTINNSRLAQLNIIEKHA